uniref:Uncharacterized protein n=1 Tax=Photinus pyralis TaxID=7054 RepID=A0A1Y1KYQ7_PHOPY
MYNVPIDGDIRMRPQLRPPILRAKSPRRRVGIRGHLRSSNDRRSFHRRGGTYQSIRNSVGIYQFRMSCCTPFWWSALPVRRKRNAISYTSLCLINGWIHATSGNEAFERTNKRIPEGETSFSTNLETLYGSLHCSLCWCVNDVKCGARIFRAHHFLMDGRQYHYRQLENRYDMVTCLFSTRVRCYIDCKNGKKIPSIPMVNGRWWISFRRFMLFYNSIFNKLQNFNDTYLWNLFRNSLNRHRSSAYVRILSRCEVRFNIWKYLRNCRYIVLCGLRYWTHNSWRCCRSNRFYSSKYRYSIFKFTVRPNSHLLKTHIRL